MTHATRALLSAEERYDTWSSMCSSESQAASQPAAGTKLLPVPATQPLPSSKNISGLRYSSRREEQQRLQQQANQAGSGQPLSVSTLFHMAGLTREDDAYVSIMKQDVLTAAFQKKLEEQAQVQTAAAGTQPMAAEAVAGAGSAATLEQEAAKLASATEGIPDIANIASNMHSMAEALEVRGRARCVWYCQVDDACLDVRLTCTGWVWEPMNNQCATSWPQPDTSTPANPHTGLCRVRQQGPAAGHLQGHAPAAVLQGRRPDEQLSHFGPAQAGTAAGPPAAGCWQQPHRGAALWRGGREAGGHQQGWVGGGQGRHGGGAEGPACCSSSSSSGNACTWSSGSGGKPHGTGCLHRDGECVGELRSASKIADLMWLVIATVAVTAQCQGAPHAVTRSHTDPLGVWPFLNIVSLSQS